MIGEAGRKGTVLQKRGVVIGWVLLIVLRIAGRTEGQAWNWSFEGLD